MYCWAVLMLSLVLLLLLIAHQAQAANRAQQLAPPAAQHSAACWK
jgi:hypothetical protein